jgi:hypothetical protein
MLKMKALFSFKCLLTPYQLTMPNFQVDLNIHHRTVRSSYLADTAQLNSEFHYNKNQLFSMTIYLIIILNSLTVVIFSDRHQ